MPNVGDKAPDFNLLNEKRERLILSKMVKNGKVLLVFYPGDDTPVCTAQLCDYRDHYEDFKKLGVQIFGITNSTNESQEAFSKKNNFSFPLLADYDSRVTKKYKVMSIMGVPKRALFLIDEEQKIIFKHVEKLPFFRRPSDELLKKIGELVPPTPETPPAKSEAAEGASPTA